MSFPCSAARFEVEVVDALPLRAAPRPSLRAAAGGGEPRWIVAVSGETLLRALQRADAPVLSICGGQASCGACRVEIEADWLARLAPANTVEAALLDALDDPLPGHRLACQLAITPALAGLRLTLAP